MFYVLEEDEYTAWENSFQPGSFMGYAHDSWTCPLASFLSDRAGEQYQVTYESVDETGMALDSWYEQFSTGEKRTLPEWAYQKMMQYDKGRAFGDPIFKE